MTSPASGAEAPTHRPPRVAAPAGPPPAEDGRPAIVYHGRDLDAVARDAFAALRDRNVEGAVPFLFTRENALATIERPRGRPPAVREVGFEGLLARLAEVASWRRTLQAPPSSPPSEVARYTRQRLHAIGLPELRGLSEVPIIRPDGSVLDRLGYDEASGFAYLPDPALRVPHLPRNPGPADVVAALDVLADVFVDFPFDSDADRAALYALLLSLVCRPIIGGPLPLLVIEAPTPGTGKSLLASVVGILVEGRAVSKESAPTEPDEWRKKVFAILRDAPRLVILDNVAGTLRAPALDLALTSDTVSDRILGKSDRLRVPNRAAWVVTSNNATIAGDLARRVYICRLDAKVERPSLRSDFTHPDILGYAKANRGKILAALLTLTRAWIQADEPAPPSSVPRMGSFEDWRHVCGGILAHAGVPGFLANAARAHEDLDEAATARSGFFACWADMFGSAWVTAADVFEAICRERIPEPPDFDRNAPKATHKLGNVLRTYRDAIADGRTLQAGGLRGRAKVRVWRVVGTDGSEFSPCQPEKVAPI